MKFQIYSKLLLFSFLYFKLIAANALIPIPECKTTCPTPGPNKHCVNLESHQFYYRMEGNGSPTIIFSSGTGFSADEWFATGIASELAKKARVFSYDRLYTFNSCNNKNIFMSITAKEVVKQLHALLQQEKINPPYILVGHSFGGLYMLLYAIEHPDEIKGIVLLDATSTDGPTPLPKESINILKRLGNPQNPVPENPLYDEIIGQLPSYFQMQEAAPLRRNIPLTVMYATKHCLPKAWVKKSMCMTKDQENDHAQQQINMYNMSDRHELIRVDGDHMSFFSKEKMKMVVDAINIMLEKK